VCNNIRVARKYELKKRADRQDETRQRIVDATVRLHTTVGPARTSISAIAEGAGVERHTVYRHFPDERSLFLACSGQYTADHPLPDPAGWTAIADPEERLRRGVGELYAYYETYGDELAPIVRDLDVHPPTREVFELRMAPVMRRIRETLSQPFRARGATRTRIEAMLDLVLDLRSYQLLAQGASPGEQVEAAVRAVVAQSGRSHRPAPRASASI
jgi:AcrR family transcriptional regulator